MSEQNDPQLFINSLESNAQQNIIKLDQKLKGLRTEVEVKLNSMNEAVNSENGRRLTALLNEIEQAIKAIDGLVNLIVTDEETNTNSLHSEEINQFNKVVSENLEKIIKIKNEL